LNLIQLNSHEALADNSSFFNQPQIREVETIEFPVEVKDNIQEKDNKKRDNIAGAFEALIEDFHERTGKENIEEKEERYSKQRDSKKQPVGIGFKDDLFSGKITDGIRVEASGHKI
jgi:hypothetical protein